MNEHELLDKILSQLNKLNEKFDAFLEMQRRNSNINTLPCSHILDASTLLQLPKHLQLTGMAILRLGRATALDVAQVTHKSRAQESAYLNQLVVMGILKLERKGRCAYFLTSEGEG